MRRLGFEENWINLMVICLKSVTYSILVNGEPKWLIHLTRAIRQGDPLSPFLFLLCTEGLHSLLSKAVMDGSIKGFSLCRLNRHDCKKVLDILATYESVSGQQIN